MLAELEARLRVRGMERVRRGDQDGIELVVCQHRFGGRIPGGTGEGRRLPAGRFVGLGDGSQVDRLPHAGHGAQTLFGRFGGPGLQRTAGWLESIGIEPGARWARLAGLAEFGGGFTGLGRLNPLGSIATLAP